MSPALVDRFFLYWISRFLWNSGFYQPCIWVGKRSGYFARVDAANKAERIRAGWR